MNGQRWLGGGLLVLLLLPVVLSSPSPAADIRSGEPLGMSRFASAVSDDERELATLFASQAALRHVDRTAVVLVPGVPRPLTGGEARALSALAGTGAQVWLLDEVGNAHRLLEGTGIRVVPEDLLDPDNGFDDPGIIEAEATLANETYRIVLLAPTLLEVNRTRAAVVARSAEVFRDVDRSGAVEAGDPGGAHPVVARAELEGSTLLVFSDAGLFANSALAGASYENRAFLDALLAGAPSGTLVVDTSRHTPMRAMAPLQWTTAALLWLGTDRVAVGLLVLAGIGLLVLLARRAPHREAWGAHEHDLGRPRPLDPNASEDRLRRLLIHALHDRTGQDAEELLGLDDAALERLANEALGPGQYLSGRGEIGTRFASISHFVDPGGPSP